VVESDYEIDSLKRRRMENASFIAKATRIMELSQEIELALEE
jgi:hypothetical protein